MKLNGTHSAIAALALAMTSLAFAQEGKETAPATKSPHFQYEESDFITRARRLTYEGKRAGEGYFSFDGKKLVFQSERIDDNPFFQIYSLDLETGETTLRSTGTGKTTCSFYFPGSDKVEFASTHLDEKTLENQKAELEFRESGKERRYSWDYDPHFDIFATNEDGEELTRLTDAWGYDAEGSNSPDGKHIAFTSMRSGYGDNVTEEEKKILENDPSYFGEIYIMDADGCNQVRLTETPGYDGGPFFSPDGKRIIWRRFDESGLIADVWTMDLDGSNKHRVTDFKCMSWAPYFHPSGEYIIFASNKLGFSNFELYIVDRDGKKEPVRVSYNEAFDGLPVFHPDGNELCWTSNRHGEKGGQLFYAKWNHEMAMKALNEAPLRNSMKENENEN